MANNSEFPEGIQETLEQNLPVTLYSGNENGRDPNVKSPDKAAREIIQVKIQDVYIARKKERDGRRTFIEKSEFLSRLFRKQHIAPKTAQETADEERGRKKLSLLKEAMREFGEITQDVRRSIERALPNIIEYEELHPEQTSLKTQEYAKYQCERNRSLLTGGHYEKWRATMLDPNFDISGERERHIFFGIVKIEAERAFTEALKSKDPERIAEGFMELGGIALFEREDLLDVPAEIMNDSEIKNIFIELLCKFLAVHPKFYFRVRKHLVKLDFFESHEEIDRNPAIQKAASVGIHWAFEQNPALFSGYVDTFLEEGADPQLSKKEKDFFVEELFKRLRVMAKESVIHYLALRKQFHALGLMDGAKSDGDPEVCRNIAGHVSALRSAHPMLFNKLMFYWRKIGLQDPDDSDDECNIQNSGTYPSSSDWKNLDPTSIANRALRIRQQEERNYQHVFSQLSKYSAERVCFDHGQLLRMQRKYPQYDPENNGNGYMANMEEKE